MSTSIFVGHGKPPANTVSGQMCTILSMVCEVDMETGVIIEGWPLLLSGGYHRLHRPLLLRRAPEPA